MITGQRWEAVPGYPAEAARPGPEMTNCPTIATALNESQAGPISGLTGFLPF